MSTAESEYIYAPDMRHRIAIFRSPSGAFTYREERYFQSEAGEGWASLGGNISYFADIETAKREAETNAPWCIRKTEPTRVMKSPPRRLVHEVWEDLDDDGQWLAGICLAGPHGTEFRKSQSKNARMIARLEASSHFEAMTEYHRILDREPYISDQEWDHQPYPAEWFDEQNTSL